MTSEARIAALAERERIARLAEACWATYDWKFQACQFSGLIRSGATAPPWKPDEQVPDPLSASPGDGSA